MIKAFSYVRFSTLEQSAGDSLRRQLDAARAWCADRGLALDDTLRDLGRSAYRGSHAQFGALRAFLKLVEDGEVPHGSYLIVESLDRLSREAVLDAAARLFDLIRAGITVVTLSDRQEYSAERLRSDWAPLVVSIAVMARAHEESRLKGERVGEAWEQKRLLAESDGQAMTAITPGWIRLVGGPRRGKYELIEERADIVRSIFQDTIAGLGRRQIAKALNEKKIEPWGEGAKKGVRWHDSYVQKILGNPAVFGRFEPLSKRAGGDGGTMVLDGYFPPVVDEATFYAAKAASGARRMGQGRPSKGHRNLLRGLAKCRSCGNNLILLNKGARSAGPKLICGSAYAASGCSDRTTYPYALLETYILSALNNRLSDLLLSAENQAASARLKEEILLARRQDKERQLLNLIELVSANGGGSMVAAKMAALQEEMNKIDEELSDVEVEVKSVELSRGAKPLEQFKELQSQLRLGDEADVAHARAAVAQKLQGIVKRIVIDPKHAHIELADGGEAHVAGPISTKITKAVG